MSTKIETTKSVRYNPIQLEKISDLLELPSNMSATQKLSTILDTVIEMLENKSLPVKTTNLDTPKTFFINSKPEVQKAVSEKLELEDDTAIEMTPKALLKLACELSNFSEETIVQDAIETYSQTLVSRFIDTGKKINQGIAGSADQRIIDALKFNIQLFESDKKIKSLGATKIFGMAGTSQQTFKNFLRRYSSLKPFFYSQEDVSLKVTRAKLEALKKAFSDTFGDI